MSALRSTGFPVLVAAMTLLVTSYALAKDPTKTPCTRDGQRICKTQNVASAESCLRQHLAELTPACKAYLAKKNN